MRLFILGLKTHDSFKHLITLIVMGFSLGIATASAATLNHRSQTEVLQFLQTYQPGASIGKQSISFNDLVQRLLSKRVILVGEIHDRYDHHLNQLALLKALSAQDPNIGIGVEWFQQPFQPVLDAYLAGRIDETEMLKRSGYYNRWRYDYRMLRPILIFAKDNHIPVLALNAPVEITQKVAQGGLEALSDKERAQLPKHINPPESSYLQRLRKVFMRHGTHGAGDGRFENFALVQRIWDETMAANAVDFLQANPRYRLMIFSGVGHISDRMGIPSDMARTIPTQQMATVMTQSAGDIAMGQFDYFMLSPQPHNLPPTGKLGAWFEPDPRGLQVSRLAQTGAAAQAGMMTGDRLRKINNIPVRSMSDLLSTLAGFNIGDTLQLTLERDRLAPKGEVESHLLTLAIKLQ